MNKFDINNHHRRSIRMKGYDYSRAGLYFITICTQHRQQLFGTINGGEMHLNPAGQMVEKHWNNLSQLYPYIEVYASVVMPNHLHGIIGIVDDQPGQNIIGRIIGDFKSLTTLEYTRGVHSQHWTPFDKHLWQRNFYEHIIRNSTAFDTITNYIVNNPIHWDTDENNIPP